MSIPSNVTLRSLISSSFRLSNVHDFIRLCFIIYNNINIKRIIRSQNETHKRPDTKSDRHYGRETRKHLMLTNNSCSKLWQVPLRHTHTHTYANKCESTNGNHGLLSCIYLARNLAGENFLLLIICLIACISCACCDLDVFSRSTSRNNKATVVQFIIFGVNLVYFIIITVSFCIEAICHFILKLMYNFIKQSSAARSVSWSV